MQTIYPRVRSVRGRRGLISEKIHSFKLKTLYYQSIIMVIKSSHCYPEQFKLMFCSIKIKNCISCGCKLRFFYMAPDSVLLISNETFAAAQRSIFSVKFKHRGNFFVGYLLLCHESFCYRNLNILRLGGGGGGGGRGSL